VNRGGGSCGLDRKTEPREKEKDTAGGARGRGKEKLGSPESERHIPGGGRGFTILTNGAARGD